MYIYIHVYIYMYIHIPVYVSIYLSLYTYAYMHKPVGLLPTGATLRRRLMLAWFRVHSSGLEAWGLGYGA